MGLISEAFLWSMVEVLTHSQVVQCASYTVPAGCTLRLGHHRLHITRSRAGQENHFLMSRPSSPNGLIVY